MIKDGLIASIVAHLEQEHQTLVESARAAHAAATDDENKAENKYDTRALEASYLAGAQARRASELMNTLARYHALSTRAFSEDDAIGVTALVQLERDDETRWYFLGPCGGGIKVEHAGHTVVVITPAAPLGRQLIGKQVDDSVSVRGPGGEREYDVLRVL